jgi:hypothetical protein
MVDTFHGIDDTAGFPRVDTKNYMIPHTRMRGYLIATLNKDIGVPSAWKALMKRLESPATATVQDFLLHEDDPRLQQARFNLIKAKAESKARPRVDWNRCELRHEKTRLEEELGDQRPLTRWVHGGVTKFVDFAWNDWGSSQVRDTSGALASLPQVQTCA